MPFLRGDGVLVDYPVRLVLAMDSAPPRPPVPQTRTSAMPTHHQLARDSVAPEDPIETAESAVSEPGPLAQALRLIAALRATDMSDTEILDLLTSAAEGEPPAMDSAKQDDFLRRFPDAGRLGGGLQTALPARRPVPRVATDAATLDRRAARFPHSDRLGR